MTNNSGAEYYTPLRTEDPEERHVSRPSSSHGESCRIRSIPYGGSLDFTPTALNPGSGPGSSSQAFYTYTYRYGPPGVAGLLRNKYTFACALFASIGGLTFGYDQGVIANVLVMKDFLERWPDVGAWEKGLMSMCHIFPSLVRLGFRKTSSDWMKRDHVCQPRSTTDRRTAAVLELFALAGSLTYGVLADKYSRRTTFVTACGKHMYVLDETPEHRYNSFSIRLYRIPDQPFSASGRLCNVARIDLATS